MNANSNELPITADDIITHVCKDYPDLLGTDYIGALEKYLSPDTKQKIVVIKTEDGGRPYRALAYVFHEALMSKTSSCIDKKAREILGNSDKFIECLKMAEKDCR